VILIIFLVSHLKREHQYGKDSNKDCTKQEKQEHNRRERETPTTTRQGSKRHIWQGATLFPNMDNSFWWKQIISVGFVNLSEKIKNHTNETFFQTIIKKKPLMISLAIIHQTNSLEREKSP
jgi:hypothetical protein